MTVLIVPSWYKPGGDSQLGAFFREQALALKKKGINIIVADATLQNSEVSLANQFRLKHFEDDGMLTYSFITPTFGGWRVPRLGALLFYHNLERIYRKLVADGIQIDVIHAHSFFPGGVAAVRLGKKYGIPVVMTEHSGAVLSKNIDTERQSLLKECLEGADALISVSHALKKALVDTTDINKEIEVIPNMVSSSFQPHWNARDDGFTIVSIGNLIRSKRFDLTICAFASAFGGQQNITLKIIGDGPLRKKLEEMSRELHIADQVVFTGRLSRAEVAAQLAECDLFVLASDFETFGVVYIEALACGLPVIGTRNGGAEDIITEDVGCLVDINNQEQLAEAMKYVYGHFGEVNKRDFVNWCQERFGEDAICKEIIGVYQQVRRLKG